MHETRMKAEGKKVAVLIIENLGKALNRYFEYVIELNAPNKKEKHWGC